MSKINVIIKSVKNLKDADLALMALTEINARLEVIKGKQSKEEIERLKAIEKYAQEASGILKEKGRLLKILQNFAEKNREKIFGDGQSIKLSNGRIGFLKSKKALAKMKDNPYTEEQIAQKIFIEIGDSCAEQTFRMKKEEIKKRFSEEDLNKYGLYIYQMETFFAEDTKGARF